jgi:hypothetical protein
MNYVLHACSLIPYESFAKIDETYEAVNSSGKPRIEIEMDSEICPGSERD